MTPLVVSFFWIMVPVLEQSVGEIDSVAHLLSEDTDAIEESENPTQITGVN